MAPGVWNTVVVGLLAGVSLALVCGGILGLNDERGLARRLARLETGKGDGADGPPAWLRVLASVLMGPGRDREEIQESLAIAGYRAPSGPVLFALVRALATLGVATVLFGWAFKSGHPSPAALFLSVGGTCVAFLAPKLMLRMGGARRQRKINAELPFTLNILVMMLESGISIDQCFRAFAQSEGRAAPLVQEAVEVLVRDVQYGVSYEVALSRWADRLGVPGARELAGVIQQSLIHGTPSAKMLREFSKEFSEKRVAAARETIGRKSTKMTLAMLVFIMPALLIVLAGPAVATLGVTMRAFIDQP